MHDGREAGEEADFFFFASVFCSKAAELKA
jgi:hypothetical protein